MSAREFYDAARIPDSPKSNGRFPGVFHLGCIDRRVSFAAQQQRAVNIIEALEELGHIASHTRIGIVGGGVAGLTAAAHALSRGYPVTVFEKHSEILSLQAGSSRWLHPNIYDWPRRGWDDDSTSLPTMNWTAARAQTVVSSLRGSWQKIVDAYSPRIFVSATDIVLSRAEGYWNIVWAGHEEAVDVVILAVGFGEEVTYPGLDSRPYWHDNDFHQRMRDGGRVLVSGCGDGGLTDTLLLSLRDFQQEWLQEFGKRTDVLQIGKELLRIEEDTETFGTPDEITAAYRQLGISESLQAEFDARRRPHVSIALNAPRTAPFDRSSAILHRLLVEMLFRAGGLTFVSGTFNPRAATRTDSERFLAVVEPNDPDQAGHQLEVDLIVVRQSPAPALEIGFPEIWSRLQVSRSYFIQHPIASDRSRRRLWSSRVDSETDGRAERSTVQSEAAHEATITAAAPEQTGTTPSIRRSLARCLASLEGQVRRFCADHARSRHIIETSAAGLECTLTMTFPDHVAGKGERGKILVEARIQQDLTLEVRGCILPGKVELVSFENDWAAICTGVTSVDAVAFDGFLTLAFERLRQEK